MANRLSLSASVAPDRNRRRFPRLQNPPVNGRLTVHTQARLIDISPDGMAVEGSESLFPNRALRLTLRSPEAELRLVGTGIWNRLTGTRPTPGGDVQPLYRGGIRFAERGTPGTSTDLELHRFIATHAVESERIGDERRYRLRPDVGPISVETEVDFRVRNISASGMLIETDLMSEPPSPVRVCLRLPWVFLELLGRLVRSQQLFETGVRTHLAVEFEGLEAPVKRQIQGLVAEGLGSVTPLSG